MAGREATLWELIINLCDLEYVEDAWLANSFTDQLLVIDLHPETSMTDEVRDLLADHDLYGFNEVYDIDNQDESLVGSVADLNRHQFVDVRTKRSDG